MIILLVNCKKFSSITNLNTGGLIKQYVEPKEISELIKYSSNKNYFVIGDGTNTIASDNYYNGTVISLNKMPNYLLINNNKVEVSSNFKTRKLGIILSKLNYSNLDFFCGIPGQIGGAIYNNSGAMGYDTSHYLDSIKILKAKKVVKLYKNDLNFSYRKSILHKNKYIVLNATFYIIKKCEEDFNYKDILSYRRQNQRVFLPTCGSTFKNLDNISAWKVIKGLYLDNKNIRGVRFSKNHSNFLEVHDKVNSTNIINLIKKIQKKSLQKKYTLNSEITFVNFNY